MSNLVKFLPVNLVLTLARPYLAGADPEQAMNLAKKLLAQGWTSTFDFLGESAKSTEECQTYQNIFMHMIDLIAENSNLNMTKQKKFTITFKPSMFCYADSVNSKPTPQSYLEGYERIKRVVKYAQDNKIGATLEAEDHRWTDFQLNTYFSLLDEGLDNLGTVLQTRLFRTHEDIKRFDNRTRVRLVIGIYEEKSDIAYTDKNKMKELLVDYSRILLKKGAYVEIATHDQKYIDKFLGEVTTPLAIDQSKFEMQFLLGVPRTKLQKRLSSSGVVVRLYLPFGANELAGAYCKRRLQSNPNILLYGLKNLLRFS